MDIVTALTFMLSNVILHLTARSGGDNLHAVRSCQGNLTLTWLTWDDDGISLATFDEKIVSLKDAVQHFHNR